MEPIVTRFAPSPTGHLHIGGARTALFCWLLARHTGGSFLLRIEDTDRQRSTKEFEDSILEAMAWLGLKSDQEPVHQSDRVDAHNAAIDRLLQEGKAYWCECTPDQVEAMRERARAVGAKPKYDGTCRERGLGPGEGRVVRFKTPPAGDTAFHDMVKGRVSWPNQELDDMILRRSDGSPTYNLAVVVDDHDMGVTHVIRGDDHVANTPRQILLYQALGWDIPKFGHVPMILGPDKKKLSKRHGALAVIEYRQMGYLPEAMINCLARLGWSHGDQEIFSSDELIEAFDPHGFGSSAAVFDMAKLDWLNSHYIKESTPKRLAELLKPYFQRDVQTGVKDAELFLGTGSRAQLAARVETVTLDYLERIIPLYQPRSKTLAEMAEAARFFVLGWEALEYDPKAVKKFLTEDTRPRLKEIAALLRGLKNFDEKALEETVKGYMEEHELSFKQIAQPIRVAITGKTASPGLFETMAVLRKNETVKRLLRAADLEQA
ncbi:MAG: glutamyl-tRNA synthetase [Desulfovibrionales bacterium]|jgi:glutamyl-tRNA synthetase|nr:glutamyl-tRNA synthetase [Desulfovibrionales bacterium]